MATIAATCLVKAEAVNPAKHRGKQSGDLRGAPSPELPSLSD